jgi:glycerophosphoryl diester phosphodiesterase
LAFNHKKNEADVIKKVSENNIKLCSWTVDDLETMERLYNLGVKYITTNAIIPR